MIAYICTCIVYLLTYKYCLAKEPFIFVWGHNWRDCFVVHYCVEQSEEHWFRLTGNCFILRTGLEEFIVAGEERGLHYVRTGFITLSQRVTHHGVIWSQTCAWDSASRTEKIFLQYFWKSWRNISWVVVMVGESLINDRIDNVN